MKTIRTAIIGTGSIAQSHVNAIRSLAPRVEVIAALDIDPGRLAPFCDANQLTHRYQDFRELLAKEKPDLVQICTPPGTHCGLSVQALQAARGSSAKSHFAGRWPSWIESTRLRRRAAVTAAASFNGGSGRAVNTCVR